MIVKNPLDNLSGQEIKEMIYAEKINLEELDASALRKLINYETDMLCFGDGDIDLISKCSEMLEVLAPNPMSTEEFMNIIKKNKKEYITIIDDNPSCNDDPKRRFIFKRIAVAAAAILIIMTTAVCVAGAFGINILEEINKIIRQEDGARTDIGGVTFHNGGEAKYYSSIEEMAKSENLNILYPMKLPENIIIEKIILSEGSMGNDKIRIFTNIEKVMISIELNASKENVWEEHNSFYEVNDLKFHIFQENGVYFASCFYKANYYSIQANNYDDLILIIDNLKE